MDNIIERTERDRDLFQPGVREQLLGLVGNSDPAKLTAIIIKMIETHIVIEEIAAKRGVEVSDEDIEAYMDSKGEFLHEQTNREITKFIGAIYSQEG